MKRVHTAVAKSPAKSLFVWFLGLIAVGTFLLLLPICHNADAKAFSLSDAAFTATSASCVTGLAVRSTPNDFSFLGQLVILLLIQLGGLGILTVATVFYVDLTGRSTATQQSVIEETLGASTQDNMQKYVNGVVRVTLLIEGVGALILIARRLFMDDAVSAIWWGIFHSISAFCNGGFALQDDSLSQSVADPVINFTIIALILAGGIGYPVIRDLHQMRKRPRGERWRLLAFHTKLTLTATVVLTVIGVLVFWWFERNNTLASLSPAGAFWATFFQAVTPRTAGFNTLPMAEFTNATLLMIIIAMLIGGNSCSTAGGMKVSTISVLVLNTIARFRGKQNATLFDRCITSKTVSQAGIVLLAYVSFAAVGLLLVVNFQEGQVPHSQSSGIFLDAFFEVFSALATVGLSVDFTSHLTEPSRWVIMCLMFAGRIGPLAVVMALSRPMHESDVELKDANPLIG